MLVSAPGLASRLVMCIRVPPLLRLLSDWEPGDGSDKDDDCPIFGMTLEMTLEAAVTSCLKFLGPLAAVFDPLLCLVDYCKRCWYPGHSRFSACSSNSLASSHYIGAVRIQMLVIRSISRRGWAAYSSLLASLTSTPGLLLVLHIRSRVGITIPSIKSLYHKFNGF